MMATFLEAFMYCWTCNKVTRWACMELEEDVIEAECEECERQEEFDSWSEVILASYGD